MAESDHGTCKASKFASEDIISRMPENIISNILDRLQIQDAVKTSILSSNWRFSWTMCSKLVFDENFFKYLRRNEAQHLFNKVNIGNILLNLKGSVTKFVLYIPNEEYAEYAGIADDISQWILILSTKGLKEFFLINDRTTPLELPSHLFSCLELKHLKLYNCCLYPVPGFHVFQNLSSSDFQMVKFDTSCNYEEFIAQYEILKTNHQNLNDEVTPVEIAKLENLKLQSLLMCKLDSMAITGSNVFQLMGFLPKFEELELDYRVLRLVDKRVHVTLKYLKTLILNGIDFGLNNMVSGTYDLINGSPNLQTLKITAYYLVRLLPHPPFSGEVECGIMGKLQLQNVKLECIKASEIEVCFIKSLLANSPLLKKMFIFHETTSRKFREKLLKLHRASPIAEIDIKECYCC